MNASIMISFARSTSPDDWARSSAARSSSSAREHLLHIEHGPLMHDGGHGVVAADWPVFLDFLDQYL